MKDLDRALLWPDERVADALAALADAHLESGVRKAADATLGTGAPPVDPAQRNEWLATVAAQLGAELEAVGATALDLDMLLERGGPALFAVNGEGGASVYLAVARARGRRLRVLTPDRKTRTVARAVVAAALLAGPLQSVQAEVDRSCDSARLGGRARRRAAPAIARRLLGTRELCTAWLLRTAPGGPLRAALREAGLPGRFIRLLGLHALQYALWITSWWLLGKGALEGRLEASWLVAWALVLLTVVPLKLADVLLAGELGARAGVLLRRRLLHGALTLAPDEVRHQGLGSFLGQALEVEAIERLGVSGGHLLVTSLLELLGALGILLIAPHGAWLAALLAACIVGTAWLTRRFHAERARWTGTRLDLTHALVESMVGHRTRLAQELPGTRHAGEDAALEGYQHASRTLDRHASALENLVPRGWLIVGLAGLAPAFAEMGASATSGGVALAIGLGGVLLAFQALRGLVAGIERGSAAHLAWKRVAPLWSAAARPIVRGDPRFLIPAATTTGDAPLVVARGLAFQYPGRGAPALNGVDLTIHRGERLLLQGASGGGKSTLAALLTGARVPTRGLVLLQGLDRATLGEGAWRRHAVLAPQFHENYVLQAPLLFNALMGRAWPPSAVDIAACEELLRELDLGTLLQRMPCGLAQVVGESGWQLSHGEKSRLFIARALLQQADLVLLDESLAALDPLTLRHTLAVIERRAKTVLVIAHE